MAENYEHSETDFYKTSNSEEAVSPSEDTDHGYPVDCLLALWKERKRRMFLVKWQDGGTSWQPECNILDRSLIQDLEKDFNGFKDNVDILRMRRRKGKVEYRLRFRNYIGAKNDEHWWVRSQAVHPDLRGKYEAGR